MVYVNYVVLVAAAVALWTLRKSWLVPWERAAVINVVFQALKILVVVTPAVNFWISSKLYALTGVWNVEELFSHIGYLIGICSVLYLVASRLDMTRAELRSFVHHRIVLPATLAIPLAVFLFVQGPGKAYMPDTVAAESTDWLHWYFFTLHLFEAFILIQATQALLILRRDPRSRRAAKSYLWAIRVTWICILAFQLEIEWLSWILMRGEVIAYALAASYTWHSKQRVGVPDDHLMPG